MKASYGTSAVKRRRATNAEMAERSEMLVDLAVEHGPCSVRHLFYASVVAGMPGITKDDKGYRKVQRLVLDLRRDGRIDYELVVDSTRWLRKPTSYNSMQDALKATARQYRRNLWARSPWRVEVWAESDSISSTIYDVTSMWDVPLMVCKGYASETFAYGAAEAWKSDHRQPVVLYVGDHDPNGLEIEDDLQRKLLEFGGREADWYRVGVRWDQVEELELPGTAPKVGRKKKPYPFSLAVEAEALPAQFLRDELDLLIGTFVNSHDLAVIEAAETSEREVLMRMAGEVTS